MHALLLVLILAASPAEPAKAPVDPPKAAKDEAKPGKDEAKPGKDEAKPGKAPVDPPKPGKDEAALGENVLLTSEDQVRSLCLALQPTERQVFPGKATERNQARAEYEKVQEQVKKTRYLLDLPWGAFTVADWDPAEKVVKLSTEKPFRAFAHALTLFDAGREEIELEAVESELSALKEGLAKGKLSLTLLFKPAEEEGSPCVVSKVKTYALAVDLLGAELRVGGTPVAKATRDDLTPLASAGGKPVVEVRTSGTDCPDCVSEVVDGVARAVPELARCYDAALAKKPTLDGSLILDIQAGKGGELSVGTVVADSVGDGSLLRCAKAALGKAKAAKPGRAQVVVEFARR